MPSTPPRRVVIVGTTGSGKTTLACRLSGLLGVPHFELDALHWERGWQEAPRAVFRRRVAQAAAAEAWVSEGNYGQVRDLVWRRADTLVWLDYPFPIVFGRLLWRTLKRGVCGTPLYNGNRENLATHFLTRDSLLLWCLKTHWRRQRSYQELPRTPAYAHLQVVRLRTPAQAERWLRRLAAAVEG
jgi:adenylate kinase family enzyme